MAVPANSTNQRLTLLAACLCAKIEEMGLPEPCFCGVLPGGLVAMDYAGTCTVKCGMAWVRLVEAGPVRGIGSPDLTAGNCGAEWGLTIELGVVRCTPVADSQGNPPTAQQQIAAAELQYADMYAMRQAVMCCDAFASSKDYRIINYLPYGPDGTVVGGTLTLQTIDGWLVP